MRRFLPLLALCLLLCGCGAKQTETEPTDGTIPAQTRPSLPAGYYDPNSALEKAYPGALRVYPLDIDAITGVRAMGNDLVVFSGSEATTLTLLSGDNLAATASVTLECLLSPRDPSLVFGQGQFSYFDPVNRETVVLDDGLNEVSHIPAPEDLQGIPILSPDRNTLYYCAPTAIYALDLETGLNRRMKECAFPGQQLTGMGLDGTMLSCGILENGKRHTLLFSTYTGQTLYEQDGDIQLSSSHNRYYLSLPVGPSRSLVFGEAAGSPLLFLPEQASGDCFFLEQLCGAVTVTPAGTGRWQLDYYDLAKGRLLRALSLEDAQRPIGAEDTLSHLYILTLDESTGSHALIRWNIRVDSPLPVSEDTNCLFPCSTGGEEDAAVLAQCQSQADALSAKYGIGIRIGEELLDIQSPAYDFQKEAQLAVLQQELALLEARLASLPANLLRDTAAHFASLNICIVHSITGSAESGSQEPLSSAYFLSGSDAYLLIASGQHSEAALYRSLYQAMETHILTTSTALDSWDTLNPPEFAYGFGGEPTALPEYLEGETRAFADEKSMTLPKEDRAAILEAGILPGNAHLFRPQRMQQKLLVLCQGIRQAYGLEDYPVSFLWEQYLNAPLVK